MRWLKLFCACMLCFMFPRVLGMIIDEIFPNIKPITPVLPLLMFWEAWRT